jgi:methyl-accepting chemotaxis protein/methyl-accepting chemotaxis protein-2 (aspartate sensor receptor)
VVIYSFSIFNKSSDNFHHIHDIETELLIHSLELKYNVAQVQQWLTDISATRGAEGYDDGYKEAENYSKLFFKNLESLEKIAIKDNNQKLNDTLKKTAEHFKEFYHIGKTMADKYIKLGPAAGNEYMGTFDEIAEKMSSDIEKIVKLSMSNHKKMNDSFLELVDNSKVDIVVISVILLLISTVISIVLINNIKNLLNTNILSLNNSTHEIELASQNLSQGAINLSNMSANQSSSIEQITATVEQTSANTNLNVENMNQLVGYGEKMEVNTNQGYQHMTDLKESMNKISESSKSINSLVNTIDEIAFQTNLLALNAAVEAARAGEHGVGFAVVAEEVRNLSQRSTNEAIKIHEVIELSVQDAESGVSLADKTNQSFEVILENIKSSAIIREQTLISSQEQQKAMEQFRLAMIEVDQVTQNLSASSEEVSALSEELNSQAINTHNVVKDIGKMI